MNSYAILRILRISDSASTFATKNRFMYDHSTRSSILFVYLEVHLEASIESVRLIKVEGTLSRYYFYQRVY